MAQQTGPSTGFPIGYYVGVGVQHFKDPQEHA